MTSTPRDLSTSSVTGIMTLYTLSGACRAIVIARRLARDDTSETATTHEETIKVVMPDQLRDGGVVTFVNDAGNIMYAEGRICLVNRIIYSSSEEVGIQFMVSNINAGDKKIVFTCGPAALNSEGTQQETTTEQTNLDNVD